MTHANGEIFHLTEEQARQQYLTTRLRLVKGKKSSTFLAYIATPRGSTTIMQAYRILAEGTEGYTLTEATKKQRTLLNRLYARGGQGQSFSLDGRVAYRV